MSTQSMFFPLVNALIVDVRRVVVAGQIAVNCPRMMQNAGLNRGHAASNLLFCRLSAAEMHRVAKRTEYSSAF
jgi:hypothetical protein